MNQAEIVDWLKSGGPWGRKPEVVETHAALVFLVGERAYKLKKAVNLGYLDFSTPALRRHALEHELKLNRRTAHEMYRRVVPITEVEGGYALDGSGAQVDFILEMKRFEKGALLSELADQGKLDVALVEKLAHVIQAFHANAEAVRGVDWPSAVKRIADENSRDLHAQCPSIFEPETLRQHVGRRERAIASSLETLTHQSSAVRRCHGDLHLANAFLEHGRPVLFDCIEFDDFYSAIPPLYDLAFLLMDLCARDLAAHANRALNAWIVDHAPQKWRAVLDDLAALPAYLALRAEVRAKTEGRKPGGRQSAERYLNLATRMLTHKPAQLIAIGGLSGTGKSTLAHMLAPDLGRAPGAIHLRTDEIRKRLAGVGFDMRLPVGQYTAERTAQVYAAMDDMAHPALRAGQAVVADAVFAREDERVAIKKVAADHSVRFIGLWLEAPVSTLEARLDRRTGDASDADSAVLHKQLEYDVGRIDWHRIDAGGGAHAVATAVRKLLGA